MTTRYQKVSADEFARRHGWPTSAVISRIRRGIYDGVREGQTWYVLRSVPPDEGSSVVADAERYQPGSELVFPERQLPWKTVTGPFAWVTWVAGASMILFLAPLLVERTALTTPVLGLGLTAVATAFLYEGLRTGTIRSRGPSRAYSENPISFVVLAGSYLFLALSGLMLLISGLIG